MTEPIPFLNRIEQQRHYGIDCGDAVCFDSGTWLPGGEHVKHITIKNVSKRTIKFTYELPKTKYFSMEFPVLATLSPGMHTIVDVAFRPVKLEAYDDCIVFRVQIIEGGVTATKGKFRLPVVAKLATLSIDTPHGIDFGFCPTAETSERAFALRNNGQIDAMFEWVLSGAGDHGKPFAIHPASGIIKAGETIEQKATFLPTIASVYVATTACIAKAIGTSHTAENPAFGSVFESQMKLSGISKFTHLSLSESELNFGEILVGAPNTSHAPTEKEFILRNRSLVKATFQISSVEQDHDPVFFFSPLKGVVPPESSIPIKVRFVPNASGTFTCDHFDIQTPGGNTVQVTCKGKAIGPTVSIFKKNLASNFVRTQSLNFQDVPVGKVTCRVLTLRNESPIDVLFHFDCQEQSMFAFDHVNGRIPPLLDFNVTVTFAPQRVGNFHRRVFLLIQNQTTMFVDILATAYDQKVRPSPFQQAHVDAYRLRKEHGLGLLSPDQLDSLLEEQGDELFLHGALRRKKLAQGAFQDDEEDNDPSTNQQQGDQANEPDAASRPLSPLPTTPPKPRTLTTDRILTRSGEASLAQVDICHEYFIRSRDPSKPIVVDCIDNESDGGTAVAGGGGGATASSSCLDFGSCLLTQAPSKKVLYVTNNTHGKVTCTWRVAMSSSQRPENNKPPTQSAGAHTSSMDPTPAFEVFPSTCDINAGGSAEFRVMFRPDLINSYYFAELEAYVAFKSNRTFRLVNVETFTPPWCVRASACGNTFASSTEQFVSKLSFNVKNNRIHFPPCFVGDSVFQTFCIRNESDTPALFSFVQDDPYQVFVCKPSNGLILANSFHLVQIRFTPQRRQRYLYPLKCIVNNAMTNPEIFECEGMGSLPRVGFDALGVPKSPTTRSMSMWASSSHSSVTTSDEMTLFIKPTSIGLISSRTLVMQNVSRVPLVFRWEIPSKYNEVFQLTPSVGRLSGNEKVTVLCEFTPRNIQKYSTRLHVAIKPISVALTQPFTKSNTASSPSRRLEPPPPPPQSQRTPPLFDQKIPVFQETSVKVVAQGTKGMVLFDPPKFEFETILVHTTLKKKFWLVNGGDCDLRFTLNYRLVTVTASVLSSGGDPEGGGVAGRPGTQGLRLDQDDEALPDQTHATLVFSERSGCIAAHSRKQIVVSFTPNVEGCFDFEVCCGLNRRPMARNEEEDQEQDDSYGVSEELDSYMNVEDSFVPKCLVKAEASFPTLLIENIYVPNVPSIVAWNQFKCYEMNQCLQLPNQQTRSRPKDLQGHQLPESEAQQTQDQVDDEAEEAEEVVADCFDFCFAPAPLNSPPQQVCVRLTNPVSLVVEYLIRFPKEGNVEMEHWAETGAPSSDEIRTDALLDAKVFTLEPRHATLLPFESVVVTFTYHYSSSLYEGVHDLPVTFEVTNGKKIRLLLRGTTLCHKQAKLFVPQTQFDLAPVMLGEYHPPPTESPRKLDDQLEDQPEEPEGSDENTEPNGIGFKNYHAVVHKKQTLAKRRANHRRIVVSKMPRAASQQIQLLNVGESPLRVEVDCHQALARIAQENYGYQVLQRVDAHGGSCTIPPKSSLVLEFAFNPLEAKLVTASFEVRGYDLQQLQQQLQQTHKHKHAVPKADLVEIQLTAMGYHPLVHSLRQARNLGLAKQPPRSAHLLALINPASNTSKAIEDGMLFPERQCFEIQTASLSADCVDFDHVGVYSSTSRVVALRNHLTEDSIEYEWDPNHPLVKQKRVLFMPTKGELGPNEKTLIRILVQTKSDVFIVNHDFECFIRRRQPDIKSIKSSAPAGSSSPVSRGPSSSSPSRCSSGAPPPSASAVLSPQKKNELSSANNARRTSVLQRSTISWDSALKREETLESAGFPSTGSSFKLAELVATPSMAVLPTVPDPPSSSSHSTPSVNPNNLNTLNICTSNSPTSPSRPQGSLKKSFSGILVEEAAQQAGRCNTSQVHYLDESPVFLRVYAHVLSIEMLERVYGANPVEEGMSGDDMLHEMSLPLAQLDLPKEYAKQYAKALRSTNRSTSASTSASVVITAEKLDVVGDVMEELLLDALNSHMVQQAFASQLRPMEPMERAKQFARQDRGRGDNKSNTNLFMQHSEDCQSIVENVMENTVFNILQELFHGGMDQELMCVPRKQVFPPPP